MWNPWPAGYGSDSCWRKNLPDGKPCSPPHHRTGRSARPSLHARQTLSAFQRALRTHARTRRAHQKKGTQGMVRRPRPNRLHGMACGNDVLESVSGPESEPFPVRPASPGAIISPHGSPPAYGNGRTPDPIPESTTPHMASQPSSGGLFNVRLLRYRRLFRQTRP